MSSDRYRYGAWRGGPDPLAPPYDLRKVLDEIGQDVLAGGSLREALRELMRRGVDGRRGLEDLQQRVRRARRQARRRGDLGGTLDQVRAALDQAVAAEQETLAGLEGDDARLAELELATVPDDVAGAVRALDDYDWRSAQARETFEAIKQMLQREVLDAQFAGMKRILEEGDPAALQAVKDMLADLNDLLAAHARGEDTEDRFRDFMDKHGELFPEQPQDVDELIDALARRQAAADRMMASLTPEQREQLGQLMSQAMADPDLASQMAQLSDNLRALRPGLERGPVENGGGEPLGYSAAVEAVAELADLEELDRQLGEASGGSPLDDVDVDALERHLGAEAAADLRALRELERELERQGFVSSGDDGLRLTPRAVRRLGETALRKVFAELEAGGQGDHDDRRTGSADEPTGLTRAWEFGDDLPLDAVRTVGNAVRRGGVVTRDRTESEARAGLLVEDFEVVETERRVGAAVALCVDLSYSMVHEGRWGPMKQTALALSHLVQTRFRQDALEIIGFNRAARPLSPVQLAEVEPEWVQGTNLQHALLLAKRHLRRHPDAEPVVLVVTDGEPTAHLLANGQPTFDWPTTPATLRATIAQVDEVARWGATLNLFMLGDDPGLGRFVDAVARRAGGRVFTPDIGRLGEYVVADYLRARRGRR
ncbi:MAG: FIG019045: long form Mg-chelase associated protein with vWA domain [uncultured Nocardioidaceae bacterium]|uniref:FIG019045: long form Mg-chelase associated protein with vWA domain n=1 Tax=uncultured Nocardioidaceae bacterium TaxID=253824 RepID=A0A6J4M6F2_9ACTN|nr:MAG: FIG019045: long form Mg-chelase associated protein with vWA domain [uncultured Nocardioidaceae bacterium]